MAVNCMVLAPLAHGQEGDWRDVKIEKLSIKGESLTQWVNHWIEACRGAGVYDAGFKGVEFIYPPSNDEYPDAFISVGDASCLSIMSYMSESLGFVYRIRDDSIIIQPDKKYKAVVINLNKSFCNGLGLRFGKVKKNELCSALKDLKIEIDDSPDFVAIIKGKALVSVRIIDLELLQAVVRVTESGLLLKMNQSKGPVPTNKH